MLLSLGTAIKIAVSQAARLLRGINQVCFTLKIALFAHLMCL